MTDRERLAEIARLLDQAMEIEHAITAPIGGELFLLLSDARSTIEFLQAIADAEVRS